MKKMFILMIAASLIIGFAGMSLASDKTPIALTDAQMAQIVAGGIPGHQAAAADLKGDMATFMPGHVVGDLSDVAHQSIAATLKGGVADLVPDHVRRN